MSAALPRFSFNMQIQHAARDEKQKTDITRQNACLPDYPFSKSAWQALLTRPTRQASNPSSLRYQAANRWPYRSLRTLPNQNQFYSLLHTPAPPLRWAAKREQGSAFRCPRPAYENEHDYKSEYDYKYEYDYEGHSAAFRSPSFAQDSPGASCGMVSGTSCAAGRIGSSRCAFFVLVSQASL